MLYRKDKRGIIPIEIEKVFFQRKHHKNNEFFAKKVNELIELSIKLYDKLPDDVDLYCFEYVELSEQEIQFKISNMSKEDMSNAYKLIEKDFGILNKFI